MVTFSFLGQEAVPVLTAPLVLVPVPVPVPALDLDLVDALNLGPRDVPVVLPRFALTHVPAPTPEAAPLLAVPLLHLPKQRSL